MWLKLANIQAMNTVGENIIATTKLRNNHGAIVERAITIWEALQKRSHE